MKKTVELKSILLVIIIILFVYTIITILIGCGSGGRQSHPVISLHLSDTFVFSNNTYSISLSQHTEYFFNETVNFDNINLPEFAQYDDSGYIVHLNPSSNHVGEYTISFDIKNQSDKIINKAYFNIDIFDTSLYTPSPNDWREKNIYFLMVDRFNVGDPSTNTANGEYNPADGFKIHGGDIRGVIDKLDYIQNLGFKSIWLTPVQKNYNAYHGYHIWDFKDIDPHFGDIEVYRELVREAHARDMYVIMDIITNHSADLIGNEEGLYDWNYPQGYTLKYHNENRKHQPAYLARLDYFYNYGNVTDWSDPTQILKGDFMGLDAFRTKNQNVMEYMSYFYAWWILKTDIDGFRIDTVKHVYFEFWEYFLPYIRNITEKIGKEDFFVFGEVWHSSDEYSGKYTGRNNNPDVYLFESLTYFPMYDTIQDVFKNQDRTDKISERVQNLTYYDTGARDKLVTFIDNHDVPRFIHNYPFDASTYHPHLKLAYLFISTFPGIPCLYYGTEQGFDGGYDPYNRENMWDGEWCYGPSEGDNFNENHSLYLFIKNINEKIDENIWIKTSEFTELMSENTSGIYAFSRHNNDSEAIIVINNSNDFRNIDLSTVINQINGNIFNNIFDNNDTVVIENNSINISVDSLSFKLYVR